MFNAAYEQYNKSNYYSEYLVRYVTPILQPYPCNLFGIRDGTDGSKIYYAHSPK